MASMRYASLACRNGSTPRGLYWQASLMYSSPTCSNALFKFFYWPVPSSLYCDVAMAMLECDGSSTSAWNSTEAEAQS